ncbi:NosD domain-containing protein [Methanococcoides sp. AM1]|uniref:NosD domain-containing protein n=1 Tax=Methanococcoides sp. AM1 TaxID=1201011 RepID=UPI001438684A|nr:NosD domain-containing protein [Methanococcoides sp. AM1]
MTIGTASADTITVNNSTGNDANYTSIQAAIDDINTRDGDTILVYQGTYTENVTVNKELTINSQSGNPSDTIVQIIDPNNYVILVNANNVNISGFTVTGLNDNVGILLNEANGCNISDNSLSNNSDGIRLDWSSNNILSSNTASSNNDTGIGLLNSSYNTLSNNIANSNLDVGIWLSSSDNNTLSNNTANSNIEMGIGLLNSDINTLSSNIVSNNSEGIDFEISSGNTLSSNSVSNNSEGINFEISSGNTLNGNIVSYNLDDGIYLGNSNDNELVNNIANWNGDESDLAAHYAGIKLVQSINNTLSSNTANWNDDTGIGLLNSSGNTLNSNILSYNLDDGIYLENSSYNDLVNNTATWNTFYGIRILQSSYNDLVNNTANWNSHVGISLRQSSTINTLSNNTANSNADIGIGLLNSIDNTLSSNIVSNNSDGIYFENSNNSLLYNNYFNNTNNTRYSGNNTGNIWNITMTAGTNIVGGHLLGGNYWVHPDGTGFSVNPVDINKDGICDEQYNLSVNESDHLPLTIVVDTLMPVISITSPADGSSTTASSVTVSGLVNGTGSLPLVTVNDINAETTIIDFNGTFTATVPLAIGANTIYANVTDAAGNTNTTSVNVTRTSSSSRGGSSGGSSGGGGGSGATGEAFENIMFKEVKTENIVGGLEISYKFDAEQNAIENINFSALRNYGRISTTIEVLKNKSAMVNNSAPGIVYSNLNIWVGMSGFATEDNIADPVISFSVAKDWLVENGIDENSIALYRHSEGKWNALNTMKVGEDDSYLYFEAKTPGFSPFAIVGFAEEDESVSIQDGTSPSEDDISEVGDEDTQTESNGIPWISTGSLVMILVGVHLLMRKRS